MVRFDQNRIVFEDEDNIDQYRVELLDTGELEIEYLPSGNTWKFENDGTLDADSLNVVNYNEPAIDHDETSNRTHDGDVLSPATLEADDGSVVNSPTNNTDIFRLADYTPEADTHDKTVSSDIVVTDSQVGTLADGEFLQNSGGSLAGAAVQGAFSNIQVFESDGTFDASNVGYAYVEVVGGGGSGGSSDDARETTGCGGGGGGYAAGFVDLSTTASVTVTVGASVNGAAANTDATGTNGNSSSFGSFMSATGGSAGDQEGGAGGAGGIGSGGDINIRGDGGGGSAHNEGAFGQVSGGKGGSSFYGGGGEGNHSKPSGGDGGSYGGGGAGGSDDTDGGDGAAGVVVVRH